MDEDQQRFQRYFPKITTLTDVAGARSFGEGNEVFSLNSKRVAIDGFMLLLATDSEVFWPFVMSSICARRLYAQLKDAGFAT
jgi:hypothetical protein